MNWKITIIICLAIIMFFGMFWTLSLSNITIQFKMDNNTKEAIESINYSAIMGASSCYVINQPIDLKSNTIIGASAYVMNGSECEEYVCNKFGICKSEEMKK